METFSKTITTMPDKYLFNQWNAPQHILQGANIELGTIYPKPIVELRVSGDFALVSFQSLKKRTL